MRDKTLTVLEDTREWLDDRNHWCRNTYGMDEDGAEIVFGWDRAVQTCLVGGVLRTLNLPLGDISDAPERMVYADAIGRLDRVACLWGYDNAMNVNDTCGYEKALKLLDFTILQLKMEQPPEPDVNPAAPEPGEHVIEPVEEPEDDEEEDDDEDDDDPEAAAYEPLETAYA
jgi:hypothetical protein